MKTLYDPATLPPPEPNPMVRKAGRYNDVTTCKTCRYLIQIEYHDKRYYKCEFRGVTHGAGTDHRVKWNACSLYKYEKNN